MSLREGDAILILPEFARLYPASLAVVRSVRSDPFRSAFNEYTVEFANSSTEKIFEFQIIENPLDQTTLIADLLFDTRKQLGSSFGRGEISTVNVVLQTNSFDVQIKIIPHSAAARSLLGHVIEREASSRLQNVEVRLMRKSMTLATTVADHRGVFRFNKVPSGDLNILVSVPDRLQRILGAFSTL